MKFYLSILLLTLFCILSGTLLVAQDTAHNNLASRTQYFKPSAVIIPAAFVAYGCLKPAIKAIQNTDDKIWQQVQTNHASFKTNAADYLMWAPSAAIYLMDGLHVQTKHSFKEHLVLDVGSIIVTGGIGMVMRKISGNIGVYNTYGTEFPSGHTANAFRGAEIFHQELKDSHELLSYSGYIVAAGVGALRIYNKNHLLTEVLAGAGLGILSTKLTYWVFDKVKYKNKRK
ncbi:MAG: phosphatase PAP2 family protein [Ferruginibacter sp.]|nr:phosphatase PAP2 family protein [Ferruginibacter sp.]